MIRISRVPAFLMLLIVTHIPLLRASETISIKHKDEVKNYTMDELRSNEGALIRNMAEEAGITDEPVIFEGFRTNEKNELDALVAADQALSIRPKSGKSVHLLIGGKTPGATSIANIYRIPKANGGLAEAIYSPERQSVVYGQDGQKEVTIGHLRWIYCLEQNANDSNTFSFVNCNDVVDADTKTDDEELEAADESDETPEPPPASNGTIEVIPSESVQEKPSTVPTGMAPDTGSPHDLVRVASPDGTIKEYSYAQLFGPDDQLLKRIVLPGKYTRMPTGKVKNIKPLKARDGYALKNTTTAQAISKTAPILSIRPAAGRNNIVLYARFNTKKVIGRRRNQFKNTPLHASFYPHPYTGIKRFEFNIKHALELLKAKNLNRSSEGLAPSLVVEDINGKRSEYQYAGGPEKIHCFEIMEDSTGKYLKPVKCCAQYVMDGGIEHVEIVSCSPAEEQAAQAVEEAEQAANEAQAAQEKAAQEKSEQEEIAQEKEKEAQAAEQKAQEAEEAAQAAAAQAQEAEQKATQAESEATMKEAEAQAAEIQAEATKQAQAQATDPVTAASLEEKAKELEEQAAKAKAEAEALAEQAKAAQEEAAQAKAEEEKAAQEKAEQEAIAQEKEKEAQEAEQKAEAAQAEEAQAATEAQQAEQKAEEAQEEQVKVSEEEEAAPVPTPAPTPAPVPTPVPTETATDISTCTTLAHCPSITVTCLLDGIETDCSTVVETELTVTSVPEKVCPPCVCAPCPEATVCPTCPECPQSQECPAITQESCKDVITESLCREKFPCPVCPQGPECPTCPECPKVDCAKDCADYCKAQTNIDACKEKFPDICKTCPNGRGCLCEQEYMQRTCTNKLPEGVVTPGAGGELSDNGNYFTLDASKMPSNVVVNLLAGTKITLDGSRSVRGAQGKSYDPYQGLDVSGTCPPSGAKPYEVKIKKVGRRVYIEHPSDPQASTSPVAECPASGACPLVFSCEHMVESTTGSKGWRWEFRKCSETMGICVE